MHDLKARVAYLQGLSSGMNLDWNSNEGKLLSNMIDVLEDFAQSFSELEDAQEQIEDYLESIDEDLHHLEDSLLGGAVLEEDYLESECPGCGEIICFESGILEEDDVIEVTCPRCHEVVFVNDEDYRSADEPEQFEAKDRAH